MERSDTVADVERSDTGLPYVVPIQVYLWPLLFKFGAITVIPLDDHLTAHQVRYPPGGSVNADPPPSPQGEIHNSLSYTSAHTQFFAHIFTNLT